MIELDTHRYDYATKHLTSHSTYILVEKQMTSSADDPQPTTDADSIATSVQGSLQQINYVPLLDNYLDLFPNYQVHVQHVEKKVKKVRNFNKSPSPAGFKAKQGKKGTPAARVPSKKK